MSQVRPGADALILPVHERNVDWWKHGVKRSCKAVVRFDGVSNWLNGGDIPDLGTARTTIRRTDAMAACSSSCWPGSIMIGGALV